MKLAPTLAATVVLAFALTACGSKDQPSADPTPTASHNARAGSGPGPGSSSPTQSYTPSSSPKAAEVTIDPCQLVTQQEASDMAHASFGPGKEEGTKVRHTCVYGAQTPNVLMVFVLQGATTGDAQAEWNQLLAEAKSAAGQAANLVQLTPDSSIGDRAEWVELNLSQIGVSGRGLAFLQGPVGVYMIDEVRGGSAPSRDAMSTQAQTVLSRLP
ncbi:hypothetical protein [Nocardioides sp.]|jgi:hypothetical protein|uniref:hypothetical protein n=1 Tax=Nocardioides sp. TaxID=35761 RepID=UPI002F3E82D8